VPASLSMNEAACVPETFFTVWHNVFERGALKSGETLLVHGGSSGIGTTAIQLAKALGSKVVVTAGSAEKCAACVKIGADRAINYRTEDFVEVTKSFTGGTGANVILDMVGGDYIARNYEAAAVDGRIVQIAFLAKPVATVNFSRLMLKRLTHTGSTLRARPVADKAAMARAIEQRILPLLQNGAVKPVMDSAYPLAKASEAHARMESGAHIGKIVLTV
jgi:NADPH2:quinone reductase